MKLLLVYFSSVHSNILVFQHQYFLHYYFSFPYSISFPTVTLRNLRLESPNRIMIGQLNVNSIRNKFEMLTSLIKNEIDILLLSETKIDETIPLEQFFISVFAKPLRLDMNSRGGGITFR